jgi:hypothetical protein
MKTLVADELLVSHEITTPAATVIVDGPEQEVLPPLPPEVAEAQGGEIAEYKTRAA